MSHAVARTPLLLGTVAVGLAVSGCQTTQDKSAAIAAKAAKAEAPGAIALGRPDAGVRVRSQTLVRGKDRSAIVVEVQNRGRRTLRGVPIGVTTVAPGQRPLTNAMEGNDPLLLRVPELAPGAKVAWVNADLPALPAAGTARVKVGRAQSRARRPGPRLRVISVARTGDDGHGGIALAGAVRNLGTRTLHDVPVYIVARRAGKPVAAATGRIAELKPGARAPFEAVLAGDGRSGDLTAVALPPSSTASTR